MSRTAVALPLGGLDEGIEGFGGDQGSTTNFEDSQITATDECVEGRAPNAQKAARFLNAVCKLHCGSSRRGCARNYITSKAARTTSDRAQLSSITRPGSQQGKLLFLNLLQCALDRCGRISLGSEILWLMICDPFTNLPVSHLGG
jgi:hypothetical protein